MNLIMYRMIRRFLSAISQQTPYKQSKPSTGQEKSAVPSIPVKKAVVKAKPMKLDQDTVELLERLSLVDFSNAESVVRLEEAVNFASAILSVDTTGVEPMVTPLEDMPLKLRDDIAVQCSAQAILKNAKKTVEGYFVAPPGNIPLDVKADYGLQTTSARTSVNIDSTRPATG